MCADSAEEHFEAAILAYLAEHPNAMDSLTGIAKWWLERQRVRVSVEALSRAVDRLVARGSLEMVGRGDDPLYRLHRERLSRN